MDGWVLVFGAILTLMVKKKAKQKRSVKVFGKTVPVLVLVIVLIVAVVVSFAAYNQIQKELDRNKFNKLEEMSSELAARLVNEFNTDLIEAREYCYQTNRKSGLAPVYCSITNTLLKDGYEYEEMADYIQHQRDLVNETDFDMFFDYKFKNIEIWCRLDEETAKHQGVDVQIMKMSCTDQAKINYFSSN